MSINRKYFVDVFESIVAATALLYDTVNGEKPYYLHGHIADVIDILNERTETELKFKKYPLIVLVQDFTEKKERYDIEYEVSPMVLILTYTESTYNSATRYNINYRTVLYPIYEKLLLAMGKSKHLEKPEDGIFKHDKTDRLFLGKLGLYGTEGNTFNDHVDAIELKFKDLEVKRQNSC